MQHSVSADVLFRFSGIPNTLAAISADDMRNLIMCFPRSLYSISILLFFFLKKNIIIIIHYIVKASSMINEPCIF